MAFDIMTLEHGGLEKSFADWGFDWQSAVQENSNQTAGGFKVARPGANITDALLFEVEDWVIIRSGRVAGVDGFTGGRIEFQGRMIRPSLHATPERDVVYYEFADPWYDLENTPYLQPVQGYVGTDEAISEISTSEVMLFAQYTSGGWVSSNIGAQARAVLQYLLDAYDDLGQPAPYQIGTIDITAPRNSYQARDQKCGEVLRMCLQGAPDANVWFDFTFTPPKINITSRANLTPVTLGFADGTDQKELEIVPRYDLIPVSILIWFKLIGSLDGGTIINFRKDKYPADAPEKGRNVVIQTVDMQGVQQTTTSGTLETVVVTANASTYAARRYWWAQHLPELDSTAIRFPAAWSGAGISTATVTDEDGNPVSLDDYPYELLDGSSVCPWMTIGGTPIVAKRVTIEATASYDEYDRTASGSDFDNATTGTKIARKLNQKLSVQITVTNGVTGNYQALTSSIAAEPVPLGMAEGMFKACATLQWQGRDVRVDPAVRVELGNAINFSSGRTEWATMNAQPQTIVRNFGPGYVEVTFGPPRHLSAGELTQMFLVNRHRRELFDAGARTGSLSNRSVGLGKNAPRKNSNNAGAEAEFKSVLVRNTSNPSTIDAQIQLDGRELLTRASGLSAANRVIKPIRIHYTEASTGTAKFAVGLVCPALADTDTGNDTANDIRLGGGLSLITGTVVSFEGNYILISPPGGGANVPVAIHPSLRESLTLEHPDDIDITYSGWNRGNQTRLATIGAVVMTQAIRPKYIVGDKIWAVTADTQGVSIAGTPVTKMSIFDPRTYCTISAFYDTGS